MTNMRTLGEKIFHFANYTVLTVFALLCIYPFYYIFIYSISSPEATARGIISLVPVNPTLHTYDLILRSEGILSAFTISVLRTVSGTFLSVLLSSLLAFVLAHRETPLRKLMYRMTISSMYLSAGLIPWFLVMQLYHLNNNFLIYILPTAVSAFYVLLVKVFMEQLPPSLEESAIIDGAGYFTVFIRIVMPLSMPILAAIGVFAAVGQWNSWFDNLILADSPKLQTLQLLLWKVLSQSEALAQEMQRMDSLSALRHRTLQIAPMDIKMTITMIVTAPVVLVYPFLQRYFVKGILLGAIKG